MTAVFISYAREDRDFAGELASKLEAQGFTVWWDWNLVGGMNFRNEIRRSLTQADKVIVLWSRNSIGSAFVTDEAGEAKNQNKLVPVKIDESAPPFGFGDLHMVEIHHPDNDLSALVGALRNEAVAWDGADSRRRKWRTLRRPLVATLFVITVIGVAWFTIQKIYSGAPDDVELSAETKQFLIESCKDATRVTATLATTNDPQKWSQSKDEFWVLYQGQMYSLETWQKKVSINGESEVEQRMVKFGQLLRENESDPEQFDKQLLRMSSLSVAEACGKFIGGL